MDFGPTADERRRLEDAKLKQLSDQTNDKLENNEVRRVQAGRVIDDALDKVNQEFDAGFMAYLTG
jgi:nitrate reductase beta subunit